jgi:two-component system OmpR family response regulator
MRDMEHEETKNILVIEDDEEITQLVDSSLQSSRYNITAVKSGTEGLEAYEQMHPDMLLLDLGLPGIDGIEICKRIRKKDEFTPIFVITGRKDEVDSVLALNLGVDDYITKPFYGRELKARIDRFFERWTAVMEKLDWQSPPEEGKIVRGDMVIDVESHRVAFKDKKIEFSGKDYEILKLLALEPGKVFSRRMIMDSVWGADSKSDERIIDTNVKRIRARLDELEAGREWIVTIRGVGFMFTKYYDSKEPSDINP